MRSPFGSSRRHIRGRLSVLALLGTLVLLASLAGCGEGDGAAASPEPTAAQTGEADLAGVRLRIADQARSVELPLRLSGELNGVPYETTFASFASGPAVNEAFRANEIDVGFMGDVPAIGSVVGDLDLRVVGATALTGPGVILLARPGTGIASLRDLKGKKVAFTTGTAQHGFVLRALKTVGLDQSDVTQIDVALQDLAGVLESGDADASVVSEEARLKYIQAHPDAKSLVTAKDLKPNVGVFFLASAEALGDPAKRAAILDLVARRTRSLAWIEAHPDVWAEEFYVKERKQEPEDAAVLVKANGFQRPIPITDEVIDAHQALADLLHDVGNLPADVDITSLYDPDVIARVNDIIKKESNS